MENCYQQRRSRLASLLPDNCGALIFSGEEIPLGVDMTYPFSVDRNFYYLTGLDMPDSAVFISREKCLLFLPEMNPKREIYEGPQLTVPQLCAIAGIAEENCIQGITKEAFFPCLMPIKKLYLDLQRPAVPCFNPPAVRMAAAAAVKDLTVENGYQMVYSLRRVKDAQEIRRLRRAVDVVGESLEVMARSCRCGMREFEWQAAFECAMRSRGCSPSFPSIVASGRNSVYLHYVRNDSPVQKGDLFLLDVGAYYEHYASDISRTYPVGGFNKRQRELYELVYDVTRVVLEHMQPYHRYQEHVDAMKAYFSRYLAPLHIADTQMEQERFLHSLDRGCCHHMGLDAHDGYAAADELLLPGMVFTNEPGIYLKDEGIGIRIEEDLLITESGNDLLSRNIPSSPEDVASILN